MNEDDKPVIHSLQLLSVEVAEQNRRMSDVMEEILKEIRQGIKVKR